MKQMREWLELVQVCGCVVGFRMGVWRYGWGRGREMVGMCVENGRIFDHQLVTFLPRILIPPVAQVHLKFVHGTMERRWCF